MFHRTKKPTTQQVAGNETPTTHELREVVVSSGQQLEKPLNNAELQKPVLTKYIWPLVKFGIYKVADVGEYLGSYLQPIIDDVSGVNNTNGISQQELHSLQIRQLMSEPRHTNQDQVTGPSLKKN